LALGKRLGRLDPVVAYPWATVRQHLRPPPTDTGLDIQAFPLHSLRLLRALMIGAALTILTVDPSQGDRWTHPILRSIGRPTLRARRHIPRWHMGHTPGGLLVVAGLPQTSYRVGLPGLSTHLLR
jgi:hypothetical protein